MDDIRRIKSVILELSSKCNLNCLYCNNDILPDRTSMPYERAVEYFYKMPDHVIKYVFHFSGESCLNRSFVKIVRFLSDNNRFMSVCTNGMVNSRVYEDALANGLNELIFAIDGFNNATHEAHKIGSSLALIKKNLEEAIRSKPSGTTVGVQYLVMRSNENEIDDMRKYLMNIGADFFYLKSISLNLGASEALENKRIESANKVLPLNQKYSRYICNENSIALKSPVSECNLVYEPVVTANGDIAKCCVDFEKLINIGNLQNYSFFSDLWNSEGYVRVRKMATKKQLESCKRCNFTTSRVIYEIGEANGRTGEYIADR